MKDAGLPVTPLALLLAFVGGGDAFTFPFAQVHRDTSYRLFEQSALDAAQPQHAFTNRGEGNDGWAQMAAAGSVEITSNAAAIRAAKSARRVGCNGVGPLSWLRCTPSLPLKHRYEYKEARNHRYKETSTSTCFERQVRTSGRDS